MATARRFVITNASRDKDGRVNLQTEVADIYTFAIVFPRKSLKFMLCSSSEIWCAWTEYTHVVCIELKNHFHWSTCTYVKYTWNYRRNNFPEAQ